PRADEGAEKDEAADGAPEVDVLEGVREGRADGADDGNQPGDLLSMPHAAGVYEKDDPEKDEDETAAADRLAGHDVADLAKTGQGRAKHRQEDVEQAQKGGGDRDEPAFEAAVGVQACASR